MQAVRGLFKKALKKKALKRFPIATFLQSFSCCRRFHFTPPPQVGNAKFLKSEPSIQSCLTRNSGYRKNKSLRRGWRGHTGGSFQPEADQGFKTNRLCHSSSLIFDKDQAPQLQFRVVISCFFASSNAGLSSMSQRT